MKMKLKATALSLIMMIIFSTTMCLNAYAEKSAVWDGSIAAGFARGSGTSSDPYIIETAEQLAFLSDAVRCGNIFEGAYIKLANDIVLNDTTNVDDWDTADPQNIWKPIGGDGSGASNSFQGIFDGDNHTISGIYINNSDDYQGLFGYIYRATIKNLGIEKSYIKGESLVGGVVGACEGLAIGRSNIIVENCYNNGTVVGSGYYIGGVAGCLNGQITVSGCYNTGKVSGNSAVGGVCGYFSDSYTTSMITNCRNEGIVTCKATCVGGVVGNIGNKNKGTDIISGCYNTGEVSGTGDAVGGVVGSNYAVQNSATSIVENCYNTGKVTGGKNCVGGVVGTSQSGSGAAAIVSRCCNVGEVNGSGEGTGGIVGWNEQGEVKDCFNRGTVTAGSLASGGVVGKNAAYANQTAFVVRSYHAGKIIDSGDSVGEVVGTNGATVENCYYLADNGAQQQGIGGGFSDKTGRTVGLTSSQMQDKASFIGFDFTDIWDIVPKNNNGYPILRGVDLVYRDPSIIDNEAVDNDEPVLAAEPSGENNTGGNSPVPLIIILALVVAGVAVGVVWIIKKKK